MKETITMNRTARKYGGTVNCYYQPIMVVMENHSVGLISYFEYYNLNYISKRKKKSFSNVYLSQEIM